MNIINILRCNLVPSLWNNSFSCFVQHGVREISYSAPLAFNATPLLMSMPTKKKRKIDPVILKLREDRKKRKIEKEIRSLQKLQRILKPLEESRSPVCLLKEEESRKRMVKIPEDVQEERCGMIKQWSRICYARARRDQKIVQSIIDSQQQALEELRKESLELYNAAVQIGPDVLPFSYTGPADTPPVKGYNKCDGEYIDISKNWSIEQ